VGLPEVNRAVDEARRLLARLKDALPHRRPDEPHRELADLLRNDLTELIESLERIKTLIVNNGGGLRVGLVHLFVTLKNFARPALVSRYCVAQAADLPEVARALEAAAGQLYVDLQHGYDAVLGRSLPEEFRVRLAPRLELKAYKSGQNANMEADLAVYNRRLRARREDPGLKGLSTSFPGIDELLGGLRGMVFLGGPPGAGKTCLALRMAVGALRRHPDLAVLILLFDPGMDKTTIYDRLFCAEAGVRHGELYAHNPTEEITRRIEEAQAQLRDQGLLRRLRVAEPAPTARKPEEFSSFVADQRQRLLSGCTARRVLTVIDYLQAVELRRGDLTPPDEDLQRLHVLEAVRSASTSVIHDKGDPFLILSEVRKGDGRRTCLSLDDLLGTSRMGYAAQAVLLLEPGDESGTKPDGVPVTLRVDKVRDGGRRGTVPLWFDHERSLFVASGAQPSRAARPAGPGQKRQPNLDPLAGAKQG
jgi:hypothetical protein